MYTRIPINPFREFAISAPARQSTEAARAMEALLIREAEAVLRVEVLPAAAAQREAEVPQEKIREPEQAIREPEQAIRELEQAVRERLRN